MLARKEASVLWMSPAETSAKLVALKNVSQSTCVEKVYVSDLQINRKN